MRVLICGGRDFVDRLKLEKFLDDRFGCAGHPDERRPVSFIAGGARGADTLAYDWACSRGWWTDVYRADWDRYGKAAGAIRNQRMLDEGKPDLVVAFPGGTGTADMVKRAELAGVKVVKL